MKIEEFSLERIQCLYENTVDINLSDSGVHHLTLRDVLDGEALEKVLTLPLGYGQCNGADDLRETIAAQYKDRKENQILVTNGSAEANMLMVMTMLSAGDELISITPNYLQIVGLARALGVIVKTVDLREDLKWQPDLEELERAITPRTKMIALVHPNNPTGGLMDKETMHGIVNLARKHGLYLHSDEVYRGAEFADVTRDSFADLYEKCIVSNGMSKAMGLPGLRIGWLVGPQDDIYKAWQRKDYTSITTSAISQFVTNYILQPERKANLLQRNNDLLRENQVTLREWLAETDCVKCRLPTATGMAYVRYGVPMNSTELVHEVRKTKSVMLLPGDVYGMDGFVRIGSGAEPNALREGLRRFTEYLRNKTLH